MPYATLDMNSCSIQINTTNLAAANLGLYGIAIQIEDFAKPTDKVPFSSVPLQFMINILNITASCTKQ